MFLIFDISGIAASGSGACSSNSEIGSHVLRGINSDPERPAVRFLFSASLTKAEKLISVWINLKHCLWCSCSKINFLNAYF